MEHELTLKYDGREIKMSQEEFFYIREAVSNDLYGTADLNLMGHHDREVKILKGIAQKLYELAYPSRK